MIEEPTLDALAAAAEAVGIALTSEDDAALLFQALKRTLGTYRALDQIELETTPVFYPRSAGYEPSLSDNPFGAWHRKTFIAGERSGKLFGKTIALKDNIGMAGVPMMNGTTVLEGFVPRDDATVVTRILEAGGLIVGNVHCECFCVSSGSNTSARGPVRNPWNTAHSSGGSSSGCAVVVSTGEVDMAVGGDQAGSIRIPAAHCGIYGMKPTHGLVPYTGVLSMEPTLEHLGPMTATVADNALLLEAIAGQDDLDPRQYGPKTDAYSTAIGQRVAGLRIGIVREGFGHPQSMPEVDQKVRDGAALFERLGAQVREISIPMHLQAPIIWRALSLEGTYALAFEDCGSGFGQRGRHIGGLGEAMANLRAKAQELPDTVKVILTVGRYIRDHFHGEFYGKAQNLTRQLKRAYDRAFESVDLLLMPTVPFTAPVLPEGEGHRERVLRESAEVMVNTCCFNASHHPAMTMPCGLINGLPVGMMLISPEWQEAMIYRAAHAFEQVCDWRLL